MAEPREAPFGHEPPGVATRKVIGVVLTLGTAAAIALVLLWLGLTHGVMPHHAQLKTQPAMLPPAPRLQPHPDNDLTALREEKWTLLDGYMWTDKSHRFARIPIERAMQIYAQEQQKPGPGTRDSRFGGEASAPKPGPGTGDPGQRTRGRGPGTRASGSLEEPQDEQKAGNPRLSSAGDHHPVSASSGGQR